MTAQRCTLCRHLLDRCAILNACSTCTSCAINALRASRRGTRPIAVPVAPSSEWSLFTDAIRAAAAKSADGLVHQAAVRPMIRGKVAPKHVGTMYRRAKAEGLLRDTGDREPSNDSAGRNLDKLDRIYALAVAA